MPHSSQSRLVRAVLPVRAPTKVAAPSSPSSFCHTLRFANRGSTRGFRAGARAAAPAAPMALPPKTSSRKQLSTCSAGASAAAPLGPRRLPWRLREARLRCVCSEGTGDVAHARRRNVVDRQVEDG